MTKKQRFSRYRSLWFAHGLTAAAWLLSNPVGATPAAAQTHQVASYRGTAPAYVPYLPRQSDAPRPQPVAEPDRVEQHEGSVDDPPHFDIEAATQAPLAIGGQVTLELPGRLLLHGGVGMMPSAYGSLVHSVIEGTDADSDATTVAAMLLENALVLRMAAGWRPFSGSGFELYAGYTRLELDATASTAQIRSLANGALPSQAETLLGTTGVGLHSTLHNVQVALGWRWVALDHLVLRANLGYLKTLDASSEVTIEQQPELATTATSAVAPVLDELYAKHVQLPVLSLSAGYRF
ncbi:MAG: hypothetical protein VB934_15495 [Polyangiaceae bacterium]